MSRSLCSSSVVLAASMELLGQSGWICWYLVLPLAESKAWPGLHTFSMA